MSIFSSIGRAVFGPSDKELIEESMEASSRYYSVPGRPSYIHKTDAQTRGPRKRLSGHITSSSPAAIIGTGESRVCEDDAE